TVTAASTIISTAEPQVLAATITAAPAKVVAAPSRRRKGVRKPQTEGQARKNMMMYLKNVARFKLDYFKGMSYDDIRLIFEAKFNSNIEFLLKKKEKMEEEENRALEDLEALWSLLKERFSTSKPKNFSDDFLLTTLEALFEKPDVQAQVWKNQRTIHGQAKVKSWKLLESCGVHIITFTTT
nr:hypothetical protein [Tanacetum cinerariifolium]